MSIKRIFQILIMLILIGSCSSEQNYVSVDSINFQAAAEDKSEIFSAAKHAATTVGFIVHKDKDYQVYIKNGYDFILTFSHTKGRFGRALLLLQYA